MVAEQIQLSSERSAYADFAVVFYAEHGLATLHSIGGFGDERRIGEGRFLERSDMGALGRIFSETAGSEHLILPERVLGLGPDYLTWYRPGSKGLMRFAVGGVLEDIEVIWPSLIFHARRRELYAAAYCGDDRPSAGTRVFLPPLANFWDSTLMCRGSVAYPQGWGPEMIPQWEFAVYGTLFTHINDSAKLAGRENTTEDHVAFWRHPSRKRYPLKPKHLIPIAWAPDCGSWLRQIAGADSDDE